LPSKHFLLEILKIEGELERGVWQGGFYSSEIEQIAAGVSLFIS